jgi:hypothetical protein
MKSDEEAACERLIRSLGGDAIRLSEPGRTVPWHAGLPDFRVRLRGVAFWMEVKSRRDKLTRRQLDFLLAESKCGEVVFAGDRAALEALVLARPSDWKARGWEALGIIAARGIRDERP